LAVTNSCLATLMSIKDPIFGGLPVTPRSSLDVPSLRWRRNENFFSTYFIEGLFSKKVYFKKRSPNNRASGRHRRVGQCLPVRHLGRRIRRPLRMGLASSGRSPCHFGWPFGKRGAQRGVPCDPISLVLREWPNRAAPFEERMPEAKKVRGTPEKPVVMSGTRARQGVISHRMVRVLVFSTVAAFVVLALLYLYYFGWPFSGSASGG
jgi:hypothetical protein